MNKILKQARTNVLSLQFLGSFYSTATRNGERSKPKIQQNQY